MAYTDCTILGLKMSLEDSSGLSHVNPTADLTNPFVNSSVIIMG
jgi:hypothetical protein